MPIGDPLGSLDRPRKSIEDVTLPLRRFLRRRRLFVHDWVRTCSTFQQNSTETLTYRIAATHPMYKWTSRWTSSKGYSRLAASPSSLQWSIISLSTYIFLPLNTPTPRCPIVHRSSFLRWHHPVAWVSLLHRQRQGLVFTGHVWQDLFKMFHPQTDGQSEVINKVIAMHLLCVAGDCLYTRVDWLSWAEHWYNTSFQTARPIDYSLRGSQSTADRPHPYYRTHQR